MNFLRHFLANCDSTHSIRQNLCMCGDQSQSNATFKEEHCSKIRYELWPALPKPPPLSSILELLHAWSALWLVCQAPSREALLRFLIQHRHARAPGRSDFCLKTSTAFLANLKAAGKRNKRSSDPMGGMVRGVTLLKSLGSEVHLVSLLEHAARCWRMARCPLWVLEGNSSTPSGASLKTHIDSFLSLQGTEHFSWIFLFLF